MTSGKDLEKDLSLEPEPCYQDRSPINIGSDIGLDKSENTVSNADIETRIQLQCFPSESDYGSTQDSIRTTSLTSDMKQDELPSKAGTRIYRYIRWNFFSVYRLLFTVSFFVNLLILIQYILHAVTTRTALSLSTTLTYCSANFCVAAIARNEHFVNTLFWFCCKIPKQAPLIFRTTAAKVYNYGGIHSGCATSAVMWYILFIGSATYEYTHQTFVSHVVVAIGWINMVLMVTMLIFAEPHLRQRLHNHFEAVHRFAGWSILVLFWLQTGFMIKLQAKVNNNSLQTEFVASSPFWFLTVLTIFILYPWLRLRYRQVRAEKLSDHALRLHFDYTKPRGCSAVRLADRPLKETHAFAVIPNMQGKGFSVIVSHAGDWTRSLIDHPPERIYVRGVPQQGVVQVASLFKSVVIVATGSGIGPCLGLFNEYPELNCRVLWSAPRPEETYGPAVIDAVRRADRNAVIIDTRVKGRQDMVHASYKLYKQFRAEAVVVISNAVLTWKIVYGLETRSIPAYGPIWDC
jgi:hypothetical protein